MISKINDLGEALLRAYLKDGDGHDENLFARHEDGVERTVAASDPYAVMLSVEVAHTLTGWSSFIKQSVKLGSTFDLVPTVPMTTHSARLPLGLHLLWHLKVPQQSVNTL